MGCVEGGRGRRRQKYWNRGRGWIGAVFAWVLWGLKDTGRVVWVVFAVCCAGALCCWSDLGTNDEGVDGDPNILHDGCPLSCCCQAAALTEPSNYSLCANSRVQLRRCVRACAAAEAAGHGHGHGSGRAWARAR